MFSWRDPEPVEEIEVTWTEFTQLFKELYKCVHVSQYDHEEKPVIYTDLIPSSPLVQLFIEQFGIQTNGVNQKPIQENEETEQTDGAEQNGEPAPQPEPEEPNLPLTILTCFYIQTHQGIRSLGQCQMHTNFYSKLIISIKILFHKTAQSVILNFN